MTRRWIGRIVLIAILATLAAIGWDYARRHPELMPWTALDLRQPVGPFTGRKLASLRDDPAHCRVLLTEGGIQYDPLPPRNGGPNCSYADAVRLGTEGTRRIGLQPRAVDLSCPVAAALTLWEWHVVQPAAERHFGQRVAGIDHLGGYNCRRINGRAEGGWSEHATANAIDIAGFRLADGKRISVLGDWTGDDAEAAFLRAVRDGACDVFATVLSPDYNAAHRDHLHFDQASRGATGWRGCR